MSPMSNLDCVRINVAMTLRVRLPDPPALSTFMLRHDL
jgi:hypothetical protein